MKYLLYWPMYAFFGLLAVLLCLLVVMFYPKALDAFGTDKMMFQRFKKWDR